MLIRVKNYKEYWDTNTGKNRCKRILQSTLENGYRLADWKIILDPVLIDERKIKDLSTDLSQLLVIIKKLPELMFSTREKFHSCVLDNKGLCITFDSLYKFAASQAEPYRWDVVPILDSVKVTELNFGWSLGGINMDIYHNSYQVENENRAAYYTDPIRGLKLNYDLWYSKLKGKEIRIVDEDYYFNTYASFIKYLENKLRIGQSNQLSSFCDSDKAAVAILEIFTGFELTNTRYLDSYLNYLESFGELPFTSPYNAIWSCKSLFSLLWEAAGRGLLNDTDESIVRKLVPFTVILKKENFQHVIDNKNKLLIKPSIGIGGSDVYIGRYYSYDNWIDIIIKAINSEKKFIVQEYVCPESHIMAITDPEGNITQEEKQIILGIFQINDSYSGCMTRAGESEIGNINVSTGAAMGVTVEVSSS